MLKLRDCPFCGSRAVMDSCKIGNQIRYFVHCGNRDLCSVAPSTVGSVSKIEVAEWWNGSRTRDEKAKLF